MPETDPAALSEAISELADLVHDLAEQVIKVVSETNPSLNNARTIGQRAQGIAGRLR